MNLWPKDRDGVVQWRHSFDIAVLDHIIIARHGFVSLKETGKGF